jgi:hypothetical protein
VHELPKLRVRYGEVAQNAGLLQLQQKREVMRPWDKKQVG